MVAQDQLHTAEGALESVRRACRCIQGSPHLKKVLRATLAAGNMLNHGTARGNATAVKLETLVKLVDMKVLPRCWALPTQAGVGPGGPLAAQSSGECGHLLGGCGRCECCGYCAARLQQGSPMYLRLQRGAGSLDT